jgi:hypothetical protein
MGQTRFFMGNNIKGYEELEITRDDMYRDGGTTYIGTPKGELYRPTSFKPELIPTWTDTDGKVHKLKNVEESIINKRELKHLHELLDVKEDNIVISK